MPATTTNNPLLEAALRYAALGWRVVPLRDREKAPRIPDWPRAASASADVVERWWRLYPRANVGVAFGVESGVVGIDLDGPNATAELLELSGGDLPETPEFVTANGSRRVYAVPAGVVPRNVEIPIDGGELKLMSDGRQSVMPPSIHPGDRSRGIAPGFVYAWVETRGEQELAAAPMPSWLAAEMTRPEQAAWADPATHGPRDAFPPGADFNRRGSWDAVLAAAGFRPVRGGRGGVRYFTRPGKDAGVSVSLGHYQAADGTPALHVFSTSIPALSAGKTYDLFGAWARLEHRGDFSAAARALSARGFGSAPRHQQNGHHKANGKPATAAAQGADPEPAGGEPDLVVMSEIEARPIEWLWRLWLARGTLSVLDGDPGLGKSTMVLDLVARVTRGLKMPPDGGPDPDRRPESVLILSAEDDPHQVLRPRLDAAGADVGRVHFFRGMKSDGHTRPPSLPDDLELLGRRIAEYRPALVVVDPLMAFLGAGYDANKDHDIRRCLHRLTLYARERQAVILAVRHLNKLSGGPGLYRGGGSIGITGAARTSLIVGRDPTDEKVRVVAMNKTNLGPFPTSLGYAIEPTGEGTSRVGWVGERPLRPDEILWHGEPPGLTGRGPGRPPDQLTKAVEFLRDLLGRGRVPAGRVGTLAAEARLSWKTLNRAKEELGIEPYQDGRAWYWELPEATAEIPD